MEQTTAAIEPEGAPSLAIDDTGVATIRLNRPHHHNRLEAADVGILRDIIATIDADRRVRVAILAASGRTFSAGYDLADLGTAPGEDPDGGIAILAETIDELERCRVPTIAALNGPVHGGGTDLALACDFRIGTPACRMTMPAVRFGLHYYHGGMRRYVTRLGLGAAKRLFLLSMPLDAAGMREIGYLDEIVPDPAALAERTRDIAATLLAAADPDVLYSMKACLNRIASSEMESREADAAWRDTRRSPRVGAAVAAARAKPRP